MKTFSLLLLCMLPLLGVGCWQGNTVQLPENVPTTTKNQSSNQKDIVSQYNALNCTDGTELFEADKLNIAFCYPTEDDFGNKVTLVEKEDNIQFFIADNLFDSSQPVRAIMVIEIDPDKSRESIVLSYANQSPKEAVCSAILNNDDVVGRYGYTITGKINGIQDMESVTQCNYLPEREAIIAGLYGGTYFFFDQSPDIMFVLNGEQDALLGEHTTDFIQSIQPRK